MTKPETPIKGGEEHDAFSRFRRYLRWKPGQIGKVKRGYQKRVRRIVRQWLGRNEVLDD